MSNIYISVAVILLLCGLYQCLWKGRNATDSPHQYRDLLEKCQKSTDFPAVYIHRTDILNGLLFAESVKQGVCLNKQ